MYTLCLKKYRQTRKISHLKYCPLQRYCLSVTPNPKTLSLVEIFYRAYGSLNVFGPYKFIGRGNIRRCGFDGVGMVLLEGVCYFWSGL